MRVEVQDAKLKPGDKVRIKNSNKFEKVRRMGTIIPPGIAKGLPSSYCYLVNSKGEREEQSYAPQEQVCMLQCEVQTRVIIIITVC